MGVLPDAFRPNHQSCLFSRNISIPGAFSILETDADFALLLIRYGLIRLVNERLKHKFELIGKDFDGVLESR